MAAIIDKFFDFMGVGQDAEVDTYEEDGLFGYGELEEYDDSDRFFSKKSSPKKAKKSEAYDEYSDEILDSVSDDSETGFGSFISKRFSGFTSKKSDVEISSTPVKNGSLFGSRNSTVDMKQNETKFESKFTSRASKFEVKRDTKKDYVVDTKEEAEKMVNVGTSGLRLVLCKPTEFDNCQGICSHLRAQMTIVLNLQYVANAADRKRIFDFVSGCCYALDGNIQKVAELIYVVAPCNVDVFAEVAEGEKDSSESYDYDNIF